jgi:CDP-glucose 4,6-dehydratase
MQDFWNGKRVLLTGHTGFKGSWLALWLHRLGAQVTGLALAPPSTPNLHDQLGLGGLVDGRIGDIRDAEWVARVVAETQPEVVLHLAAQALVRPSYSEPVATFATNVMGTVHVLEAARHTPSVRAVVVVTSDKCYENREWLWGYREHEAMGGHDPYSASKGCAELVTAAYRRSFFGGGAAVASARAGNVIGGGDWAADRLVPDIVHGLAAGQRVHIRRPDAVRPWQHVLEPLAGYLRLAELLVRDGGVHAEGWNFGPLPGSEQPVRHIANRLAALWGGGELEFAGVVDGPHEAGLLRLDASKAQAKLGWRAKLDLDTALAWTVAWQRGWLANPAEARALTEAQIAQYEALA